MAYLWTRTLSNHEALDVENFIYHGGPRPACMDEATWAGDAAPEPAKSDWDAYKGRLLDALAARLKPAVETVAVTAPPKSDWWIQRDKNGEPVATFTDYAAYAESLDKAVAAKLVHAEEMCKAMYGGAAPEPEPSCEPKCECTDHSSEACGYAANASVLRDGRRIKTCNLCELSTDTDYEALPPPTHNICAEHPLIPKRMTISGAAGGARMTIMFAGETVLEYPTGGSPFLALIAEVKRLRCLLALAERPEPRAQVVCDHGYDD